jgi:ribonuclease Z
MEDIKITFLGTGNAIPTEKRNHTGIFVNFGAENILFDCGEGIQRQFKISKISPSKLTRIFITHWHGDHILGLPGLFQTLAMSNYNGTLKIYGPHGTRKFISIITELLMHININLEIHEIGPGKIIDEEIFQLNAETMNHGIPTLAYSLILKDRLRLDKKKLKKLKLPNSPLLKQIQKGNDIVYENKKIKASSLTFLEKGKKLTIILDTVMNISAVQFAKNSNLLICESTFSDAESEKAKEYKHLTAKNAATIAKNSKSKNLIITHISQRYEHNLQAIEKEAKRTFKNTKIVKDLDSITI